MVRWAKVPGDDRTGNPERRRHQFRSVAYLYVIDGYLLLVQDVRPAQNAHDCRCNDGSELLVGREHLLNRFGYP